MFRVWLVLFISCSLAAADGLSFEQWLLQPLGQVDIAAPEPQLRRNKPNAIPLPGLGIPKRAVPSFACRVKWDEYISVLVVLPRPSLKQQAWLATFMVERGEHGLQLKPQVNYRGDAFIDQLEEIHFDFRDAGCVGEMAGQWLPDSFVLQQDGRVRILDTKNNGNWGRVVQMSWPQSYQHDDVVLEAIIGQKFTATDFTFLQERLLVHFELSGKSL